MYFLLKLYLDTYGDGHCFWRGANEIWPQHCFCTLASVDKAVQLIQSLGKGCLMAKLDLQEAYRAVPTHPSDQRLLGVSWQDTTFIENALLFGRCSAPKPSKR